MSNKPKDVKSLVEYIPTIGERRHTAMVREAKKQGYKHPGSKPMHILRNIVPAKATLLSRSLRHLFGK